MTLDENVSDLIKRIYCAGEDRSAWDGVATDVLRVTGGIAGLTSVVDLKNRQFSSFRFYGPDTSDSARGADEYADTYVDDPSLAWASLNPAARFCDSSKTTGPEEYLQHSFVKWNLARFGASHWYVGYTPPDEELSFSFSLHFPAAEGPGDPKAVRLFQMLFDHMECAVRLRHRPFAPNSARCLLVLTSRGEVQQRTAAAEKLLASRGALKIVDNRLATTVRSEQPKLDEALARVASCLTAGGSPAAVNIQNPSGGLPWAVTIRPLVESFGPFDSVRCELLVEVHRPTPCIGPLDLVQSLYGLTARELQVVRHLADGHSVESLSEHMCISANTARTHLRAVFAKTSTGRQSELLLLCAGLSHD